MAVDRAGVFRRLMALEAAAAACGELLVDATDEELEEVLGAFAPLHPRKRQPAIWRGYWRDWLLECHWRLAHDSTLPGLMNEEAAQ